MISSLGYVSTPVSACFMYDVWLLAHAFTALDFREWIGGEQKINTYCHDLALRGGGRLLEILGTQLLDESGEFTLNMVRIALFSSLFLSDGPLLGQCRASPSTQSSVRSLD